MSGADSSAQNTLNIEIENQPIFSPDRSAATTAIPRLFAGCGVICDMVVLMMLVSPGPACFRHMMAARTVFAVRGGRAGPGH